jgi:DNA topoisomerase-1
MGNATLQASGSGSGSSATRVRVLGADAVVDPRSLTADGKPKWKTPPPGVAVEENTSGEGAWIERWKSPGTGKWVYNYTVEFMEKRAGEKFVKNRIFGKKLPNIRRRLRRDLKTRGKRQILALVVSLMDRAYLRVGNETSDDDGVYGATTLLKKHLRFEGRKAIFKYVGKKDVPQTKVITHPKLVALLKQRHNAARGGDARLFTWEGTVIDAGDINDYLDHYNVTAKMFRTFHATRLAHSHLKRLGKIPTADRDAAVDAMFVEVAEKLGHTPSVCRKNYVDPTVVKAFMRGRLK